MPPTIDNSGSEIEHLQHVRWATPAESDRGPAFVWSNECFEKKLGVGPTSVELALNWPAGTEQALEAAFRIGLTRQHVWDVSALDPEQHLAVATAARYYKRGVHVQQAQAGVSPGPIEAGGRIAGCYEVRYYAGFPDFRDLSGDSQQMHVVDAALLQHFPGLAALQPALHLELSEAAKTLENAAFIVSACRRHGSRALVAIGGGLLSDVAAFAAALAGIKHCLVPTTLLAMVDAAVGGKTGVNHGAHGKNQIGAFHHPAVVAVCRPFLDSLPPRQWNSGAAECLKHLILDDDMDALPEMMAACRERDGERIFRLLPSILGVKARIVQRDPWETGERAVLNFGHTVAHGLEAASGFAILHGEAVALGMLTEISLSARSDLLPTGKAAALSRLILESGVLNGVSLDLLQPQEGLFDRILPYLLQDKKQHSQRHQTDEKRPQGQPESEKAHGAGDARLPSGGSGQAAVSLPMILLGGQGPAVREEGGFVWPVPEKLVRTAFASTLAVVTEHLAPATGHMDRR